jgi:hypothetical protein
MLAMCEFFSALPTAPARRPLRYVLAPYVVFGLPRDGNMPWCWGTIWESSGRPADKLSRLTNSIC